MRGKLRSLVRHPRYLYLRDHCSHDAPVKDPSEICTSHQRRKGDPGLATFDELSKFELTIGFMLFFAACSSIGVVYPPGKTFPKYRIEASQTGDPHDGDVATVSMSR